MPPADPAREVAQVARLRALADEAGLDPQFAEAFLNFIIAEVIHHHERIAGGGADRRAEHAPTSHHRPRGHRHHRSPPTSRPARPPRVESGRIRPGAEPRPTPDDRRER